jgi:hypothetical protein
MAIYIDESEGRLFVRYTSDDPRQAVEDFDAHKDCSSIGLRS